MATDFIARERDSGLEFIADLAATRKQIWRRACEHDGIEPDSLFVVFSQENPFTVFLDNVTRTYFEAVSGWSSLGYTGLSMGNGRAELFKPRRKNRKVSRVRRAHT